MNAGRILLRICLCIHTHTLSGYLCFLSSISASCIIMVIKVVSVITCYKSTISKLWDTKRLGRHSFRDLFLADFRGNSVLVVVSGQSHYNIQNYDLLLFSPGNST